jgi:hypothetical protein
MKEGNCGAVINTYCVAMPLKTQSRGKTKHVRSRFFALCRFLLGLLMTLIGLLGKVPMTRSSSSSPVGAITLTRASTFFFFSSTSEMNSCFPTQRPTYVVPAGGSETSMDLPIAADHSTLPSWPATSPEMDTITRGGESFGSSPRRTTSDHHEFPIKIAVGGGHRNLAYGRETKSL